MKTKPAPSLVEGRPIVVDMRDRVAGMSDGELSTLLQNATRLARSGSERQRASARGLIPAIEAEIAARHENAPTPSRSRRSAAREIEPIDASGERPAAMLAPEPLVTAHKFALGSVVKLLRTMLGLPMDGLVYEVVRQLPDERNEFQYRIRTRDGRVERIVLESQLGVVSAGDVSEAAPASGRPRVR